MKIKLYQIDAFTDKIFGGNPAAVCPLDQWLEDELMQQIAKENNLAETAFVVQAQNRFEIRWFTPTVEVDLCGHATLAAAHVLWNHFDFLDEEIKFWSNRSGDLSVLKEGSWLTLNFPADPIKQVEIPEVLLNSFAKKPAECWKGSTDYLLIFESQTEIEEADPDLQKIAQSDSRGVIISSKGDEVDFVSRFFAPQSGIDEDPVTGSAHTSLSPYWSKSLNKKEMTAQQISNRGGYLKCTDKGERVLISGQAVTYLIGEISI